MRRIIGLLGVNNVLGAVGAVTLLASVAGPGVNAFKDLPRYAQILFLIGVSSFSLMAIWNWRRLFGWTRSLINPAAPATQRITMIHQEPNASFGGSFTATGNTFTQLGGGPAARAPRGPAKRTPLNLRTQGRVMEELALEVDGFADEREDGEPSLDPDSPFPNSREVYAAYEAQRQEYGRETFRRYLVQLHAPLLAARERSVGLGLQDDRLQASVSPLTHHRSVDSEALREISARLRVVALGLRRSADEIEQNRRRHSRVARRATVLLLTVVVAVGLLVVLGLIARR